MQTSFPRSICLGLFLMSVLSTASIYAGTQYLEAAQLPAQPGWPNPLASFGGVPVTSKKVWQNKRRAELKALFQHYMYGVMPPAPAPMAATVEREDKSCFGGKATLKEVTIPLGTGNAPRIHLLLVTPNQHRKAVPAFLGLNFCGNHALVADPKVALPAGWMPKSCSGCTNNQATDA